MAQLTQVRRLRSGNDALHWRPLRTTHLVFYICISMEESTTTAEISHSCEYFHMHISHLLQVKLLFVWFFLFVF